MTMPTGQSVEFMFTKVAATTAVITEVLRQVPFARVEDAISSASSAKTRL